MVDQKNRLVFSQKAYGRGRIEFAISGENELVAQSVV